MLEVWWTVTEKMKIFIFLFLGFNVILANAGIFDKKLTIRQCANEQYAECNDCKKSDLQYDFLLNKNDKTVMRRIFFNGTSESKIEENCKIFDEKNWDCSKNTEFSTGSFTVITNYISKMTNGVYREVDYTTRISAKESSTKVFRHYCAK
jgi:hypothetical protein